MLFRRLTLVALAALAVACADDRPRLRVDVDGGSFERVPVAGSGLELASITFDVVNDGGATAFINACDRRIAASIDKRVDGRWEQFAGGICLANLPADPVQLRSGARQQGGVGIGEAGRFRVKVSYGSDASMSEPRSAVSDGFDVH
jgi:hypothetical protein